MNYAQVIGECYRWAMSVRANAKKALTMELYCAVNVEDIIIQRESDYAAYYQLIAKLDEWQAMTKPGKDRMPSPGVAKVVKILGTLLNQLELNPAAVATE